MVRHFFSFQGPPTTPFRSQHSFQLFTHNSIEEERIRKNSFIYNTEIVTLSK